MINKYQILKFLFFILFIFIFAWNNKVFAADFRVDYQVEYNLIDFEKTKNTKVNFNISITNLKSDVYVDKFSINFPKSFTIANLQSFDDNGQIIPKILADEEKTKIEMEFSNPKIGRGTVNNFYLTFDQLNLFKENGKIWEVILPVVENRGEGNYQVIVNLPKNSDKKISIAKPRPNRIFNNKIYWTNPKEEIIYAIFGDEQIYQGELVYYLKNNQVVPILTEVAFPPDTLYQKIYLNFINPKPEVIYQDDDGNYLGKYLLKPLETKKIVFNSYIKVFSKPREEIKSVISERFQNQKNQLLSSDNYWTIKSLEKISHIKTVDEAYNFVVKNLNYNYNKIKINSNNLRLGAEKALSNPNQAVCMEFSDLFIGIAREKGIKAREIEGYAFSFDEKLQPLSLASDVLHSWPEYYDENKNLWIPVDPTWENTSGIDYFSSFDLNHLVFAIHGKKSDYPLPAGMYKITDSKDISIKPTIDEPVEKISIATEKVDIASNLLKNKRYQGKILVKNNSNVYLYQIPVFFKGENINFDKKELIVSSLAPYQKSELSFFYQSSSNIAKSKLIIEVFNKKILETDIKIISPVYLIIFNLSKGLIIVVFIFTIFKIVKKKKS